MDHIQLCLKSIFDPREIARLFLSEIEIHIVLPLFFFFFSFGFAGDMPFMMTG